MRGKQHLTLGPQSAPRRWRRPGQFYIFRKHNSDLLPTPNPPPQRKSKRVVFQLPSALSHQSRRRRATYKTLTCITRLALDRLMSTFYRFSSFPNFHRISTNFPFYYKKKHLKPPSVATVTTIKPTQKKKRLPFLEFQLNRYPFDIFTFQPSNIYKKYLANSSYGLCGINSKCTLDTCPAACPKFTQYVPDRILPPRLPSQLE